MSKPHYSFLLNPSAGHGKALIIWPDLEKDLIRADLDYAIYKSERKGHLKELAKSITLQGTDYIIGLGGDGTAHEIANGIYEAAVTKKPIFSMFPVGTGNDWATYWKIPRVPTTWIKMLLAGELFDHDLGLIHYRDLENNSIKKQVFINVAGAAYDAYVVDYIENKNHKKSTGGLQYLWFGLRCLFLYTLQRSLIRSNGKELDDFFYMINIGICPRSGGGMYIVPHALPNDGLLAVTALRKISKWRIILNSWRFYTGRIIHAKFTSHFQTAYLSISPYFDREEILIEADGELLGKLSSEITCIRHGIKICAPAH